MHASGGNQGEIIIIASLCYTMKSNLPLTFRTRLPVSVHDFKDRVNCIIVCLVSAGHDDVSSLCAI
jgi:hypothetical protein